jgi:uncharacterized membrane protein
MSAIEESIQVHAPLRAVYDQWTQFEEFPKFMDGIKEVRQIDDTHLHWVAVFGGQEHEWHAEITEQRPDERVAWKNTDGKDNAGVVTFHRIDDDQTQIMVQMDFVPEGIVEKARQRARSARSSRQGRPDALQGTGGNVRPHGRRLARRSDASGRGLRPHTRGA